MVAIFLFYSTNSSGLEAKDYPNSTRLERDILQDYELLLANNVTNKLLINYESFRQSPNKYWQFLNQTFFVHWDFDATTRALVGGDILASSNATLFKQLSQSVRVTLSRYAFESLIFYGNQRLSVDTIKVDKEKKFAWLKITIISPKLPDISLDILLKRTIDNDWKGVDFRFKGITYVNLKKNSYREDFNNLGFTGLIIKLNNKNNRFFNSLCPNGLDPSFPDAPPCL